MQNIHGPLEWVSVQDMGRATEVCIQLAQLWARGRVRQKQNTARSRRPIQVRPSLDGCDIGLPEWRLK